MEELTSFLGSQFGPMCHPTKTILSCSFGKHPNHEQACQRIAHTASISMIGDGLQTGRECISIKEQRFVRKMKRCCKCCIFHGQTFRWYDEDVSTIHLVRKVLFYSHSSGFIPDLATPLFIHLTPKL